MSTTNCDIDGVCDRIRGMQISCRVLRAGKPDGNSTALVQDCIGILNLYSDLSEVVPLGLKVLDDVLTVVPLTSTIIRLEGGVKVLAKIMRTFMGVDADVLALTSRVLHKCCLGSPLMQQSLIKEKGLVANLLDTCAANARDLEIAAPLLEVLIMLGRMQRGAQLLAGEALVRACKELLVGMMGNWPVFGMVVKLIKSVIKHEAPCAAVVSGGEIAKLLLGVARLVSRLPEQRKLLKRTSRTLWIMSQRLLPPMPELEPTWPLPVKDVPHLQTPTALEADAARHMELFPEDYTVTALQQQQQQSNLGTRALNMVRPPRPMPATPPSTSGLAAWSSSPTAAAAAREPFHRYPSDSLSIDMMMHDLRRIVHPQTIINRTAYVSHSSASQGRTYGPVPHQVAIPNLSAPGAPGVASAGHQAAAGGGGPSSGDALASAGAPRQQCQALFRSSTLEANVGLADTADEDRSSGYASVGRAYIRSSVSRLADDSASGWHQQPGDGRETIRRGSFSGGTVEGSLAGGAQPLPPLRPPSRGPSASGSTALSSPTSSSSPAGSMGGSAALPRTSSFAKPQNMTSTMAALPRRLANRRSTGNNPGELSGISASVVGPGAPLAATSSTVSTTAAAPLHSKALRPSGSQVRLSDPSLPPPPPPPLSVPLPGIPSQPLQQPRGTTSGIPPNTAFLSPTAAAAGAGGVAGSGRANAAAAGPPMLSFESSFEGGNLRAAVQVYENEYDLFLAPDINDRSDGGNLCQWFFFAVSGVEPNIAYKFNIVNFKKKSSLFGVGKQPLVCCGQPAWPSSSAGRVASGASVSPVAPPGPRSPGWGGGAFQQQQQQQAGGGPSWEDPASPTARPSSSGGGDGDGDPMPVGRGQQQPQAGWVRAGHSVAYYPSPYRGRTLADVDPSRRGKKFLGSSARKKGGKAPQVGALSENGAAGATAGMCLSDIGPGLHCCTFTLQFEAPGIYFIASCYPYGYGDLQEYLDSLTMRLQAPIHPSCQEAAVAFPVDAAGVSGCQTLEPEGLTRGHDAEVLPLGNVSSPSPLVRSLLCYTLLGHRCDLLTITDFSSPLEMVRGVPTDSPKSTCVNVCL